MVWPLSALIDNLINKLNSVGVTYASVNLHGSEQEGISSRPRDREISDYFPTSGGSSKQHALQGVIFDQLLPEKFMAVVVDEVHCIIEW